MSNSKTQLTKTAKSLLRSEAYPHEVQYIKLIETHISWVFLTGKYVYKLKKPINLGFYDGSTQVLRKHLCEQEIKINLRTSSDLYIGCVDVIGPKENARVTKESELGDVEDCSVIIDTAVKMKQFKQNLLLVNKIRNHNLSDKQLKNLAIDLSMIHLNSNRANLELNIHYMNNMLSAVIENIEIIIDNLTNEDLKDELLKHKDWVKLKSKELHFEFNDRTKNDVIRECHGDLHLENIYINSDGKLVAFDAIDFSDKLRYIDPISDISFLIMDLDVNKKPDYAIKFLNYWLEETGDYSGLIFLKFYLAYRALVRAKVLTLRIIQIKNKKPFLLKAFELITTRSKRSYYIENAIKQQFESQKGLIIMHGLSGSGKSYLSEILLNHFQAIRIRSDVERTRIFEMKHGQKRNLIMNKSNIIPEFESQKYNIEFTNWLFKNRLPNLAIRTINSGYLTIIDATYLKYSERRVMKDLANNKQIPFVIISCKCSDTEARARIIKRRNKSNNVSEATFFIRQRQKYWIEDLKQEELKSTVFYDEDSKIVDILYSLNKILRTDSNSS